MLRDSGGGPYVDPVAASLQCGSSLFFGLFLVGLWCSQVVSYSYNMESGRKWSFGWGGERDAFPALNGTSDGFFSATGGVTLGSKLGRLYSVV